MPTPYQISISMDQASADTLQTGTFHLYAFKAVTGPGDGLPSVWFATSDYALHTAISWSETYEAYTSMSQVVPNGEIVASSSYPVNLGQTLQVQNVWGTGQIAEGGTAQAITIVNQTSGQLTCGISQVVNGVASPIAAFPLYGNNADVMAPIEQVFLMFSSVPLNTGTVIEQSYGPGVLVNLTASNSQAVSYELNGGWSGDPASTQLFPPQTNLVPLLITG